MFPSIQNDLVEHSVQHGFKSDFGMLDVNGRSVRCLRLIAGSELDRKYLVRRKTFTKDYLSRSVGLSMSFIDSSIKKIQTFYRKFIKKVNLTVNDASEFYSSFPCPEHKINEDGRYLNTFGVTNVSFHVCQTI